MDSEETPGNKKYFKVYIGSIPGSATKKEILKYFSQFGSVIDVHMFYKNNGLIGNRRLNKGYCHLLVADKAFAEQLISSEHYFKGRTVFCNRFLTGSNLKKNNELHDSTRVMIKYFPEHVSDEELNEFMNQFGSVRTAFFMSQHPVEQPFEKHKYKTASVQFHYETPAQILLKKGPIYFNGMRLHVENYIHRQQQNQYQDKSWGSNMTEFNNEENPVSKSKNDKKTLFNRMPEQSQAIKEEYAISDVPWNSAEHDSSVFHKPTSKQFSHSKIGINHTFTDNLLYRLLDKSLRRRVDNLNPAESPK